MTRRRARASATRCDLEVDFHGYTAAEMRAALDDTWGRRRWQGLRRVRVVHGTGEVLWRVLREWCDEKGIPWAPDRRAGATVVFPVQRATHGRGPAHRPLGALRERARPTTEAAPEDHSPAPEPGAPSDASDARDLMAEEFERLATVDERVLRRRKARGGG